MNALHHLSLEHFFALQWLLILLPSCAIFSFADRAVATKTTTHSRSLLFSLLLLWAVPIVLSIMMDGLWQELVFGELIIEPAILTLSIILIGWHFFIEPYPRSELRYQAGPVVFVLAISFAWVYLSWNLHQENLNETALIDRVSLYHSIGDLSMAGVSAVFLVYGSLQLRNIPWAGTKLSAFTVLLLTFTTVSLFNLNEVGFLGASSLSYRMGWLLAMVSLPILVSQQSSDEPDETQPRAWFPAEIGSLTAEWAALQALRISLADSSNSGIHHALLHAATQLTASRVGLILRLSPFREDENVHFLEVVEALTTTPQQPEAPLAIRLSGSSSMMLSLRQHPSIILDAEQDAEELDALWKQFERGRAGKIWLLPFRRAELALLLATHEREDAYSTSVSEIMHHFTRIADDILAQIEVGKPSSALPSNLPSRDLALSQAREHILRLTTELIYWQRRVEQPPPSSTEVRATEGENAPLIWQAMLEEKQRENARLKTERELFHERTREWEELFSVWGQEGGAMALWQHIHDEKESLMNAQAEIKILRQELQQLRHQIYEPAEHYPESISSEFSPVRPSTERTSREEIASRSFDLWTMLEESSSKAAHSLRTKAIQVQMAIQPRLPRVDGKGGSSREVLINLIEQVFQFAPRESILHIAARSQAGSLHLALRIQGESFPSAVAWQEAQERIHATGGQIQLRAGETSAEKHAEEILEIILPAEPRTASVSAAS